VEFDDASAISCTVQMWGGMLCYRRGDEANGIPEGYTLKIQPSPLEDEFDEAYFRRLAAEARPATMSAKMFLATEQRIQGLGNGVLQDILWTARIHPKRKLTTFSKDDWHGLYHAVKTVLAEMTEQGGRDTERDLFGQRGGYLTVLSKNTVGQLCPACGGIIVKEAYLGGAVYRCPQCQPLY
jgi:formamidopyrimidine-DNA glycosylase